jgi:cytochrome c oxidase assembly protein subunit 15
MGIATAGRWLASPVTLRRLAAASVVANVVIVVSGGAVRLTGSGLGCPTWPSCTDNSLTPTPAYSFHGIIEFTNRQLTFVLCIIVFATLVSAILARRERRLAALLAASIPAQAVLGGVTVLTHLNPWAVASHFLLSMGIIAVAFVLWWSLRDSQPLAGSQAAAKAEPVALWHSSQVLLAITALVLAIGTVVTGSGPHAGSTKHSGRIHLSPRSVTQLHADSVMLLIGLTIGVVVLAAAAGASPAAQRAARVLLIVELAQGLIGFVQYFTGVPAVLVGFHMFGACLVWLAALRLAALAHPSRQLSVAIPRQLREEHRSLAG